MLSLDHHGFLMLGELQETGKQYTRNFYGYPYTAYDHTVLILEKMEGKMTVIPKQWKDLGPSQQVLRMRNQELIATGPDFSTPERAAPYHDAMITGFHILHTTNDAGEYVRMGKTDRTLQEYVASLPWLHEGRCNLAIIESILTNDEHETLAFFVFGILLAHGSWTIKEIHGEQILFPVKLTLPLTSSLFGKKDLIVRLFERLHALHLAHTVSYQQSATFEYCQAVFHDPLLLVQWQLLLESALSLAKNSASDYTMNVFFNVLEPWAAAQ